MREVVGAVVVPAVVGMGQGVGLPRIVVAHRIRVLWVIRVAGVVGVDGAVVLVVPVVVVVVLGLDGPIRVMPRAFVRRGLVGFVLRTRVGRGRIVRLRVWVRMAPGPMPRGPNLALPMIAQVGVMHVDVLGDGRLGEVARHAIDRQARTRLEMGDGGGGPRPVRPVRIEVVPEPVEALLQLAHLVAVCARTQHRRELGGLTRGGLGASRRGHAAKSRTASPQVTRAPRDGSWALESHSSPPAPP